MSTTYNAHGVLKGHNRCWPTLSGAWRLSGDGHSNDHGDDNDRHKHDDNDQQW
jgi:hypothetical protein